MSDIRRRKHNDKVNQNLLLDRLSELSPDELEAYLTRMAIDVGTAMGVEFRLSELSPDELEAYLTRMAIDVGTAMGVEFRLNEMEHDRGIKFHPSTRANAHREAAAKLEAARRHPACFR